MNIENINNSSNPPVVLIAPLDWGLGHYTRCIPVIQSFLRAGATVILAAEEKGKALYEKEFPGLKILPLSGYNISYSRSKILFFPAMLVQTRKIFQTVKKENAWLQEQVKQYNIDIIISDNRYGLYHAEATSIFITHQLNIETGNTVLNKIAQRINYYFINRFSACWVPDGKDEIKLAGKLSHPEIYPSIPVRYIDILSRFSPANVAKEYDIIILLSGPEPQRSILEKNLISQATGTGYKIILVRGLPGGNNTTLKNTARLEIVNHLPATVLNTKIAASALVVCRSGYSSIMDLIALQKKAVFIPTPGQKEQEYLAVWLKENKWFNYKPQEEFILQDIFSLAEDYSPPLYKKTNALDHAVDNLLAGVKISG